MLQDMLYVFAGGTGRAAAHRGKYFHPYPNPSIEIGTQMVELTEIKVLTNCLNPVPRTLDPGSMVVDQGPWNLDTGSRILDP